MPHSRSLVIACSGLLAAVFAGSCSKDAAPPPPYRCLDKCVQDFALGGSSAVGSSATGGRGSGLGGLGSAGLGAGAPSSGGTPNGLGLGGQNARMSGGSAQGGSLGTAQGGDGGIAAAGAPTCLGSSRCVSYCASIAGACSQPYESCVCSCQTAETLCPTEFTNLLTCAGATPEVVCSPVKVIKNCVKESLDLSACKSDSSGSLCAKNLPECKAYCEPQFLPTCANGPESYSGCLCDCEQRIAPGCTTELAAYYQCTAGTPTFTCSAEGRLQAATCMTEWASLTACQLLK